MRARRVIFLCGLCGMLLPPAPAAQERPDDLLASFASHLALRQATPGRDLVWKNIGPTFCGGRVVDIEGSTARPGRFWVATATGGLWRTEDDGRSWRACFEREATASIGDIAVHPGNEDLVWLGSGESNAQGQSFAGCGVYLSADGGKSWRHRGLAATRHIGRVVIDPRHAGTVYVAAAGSLSAASSERGIYKTRDSGASWEKVLFISDRTGCIDLAMDPGNPDVLYAAAWQKERKPWNFSESGPESGIYKTDNGGKTWVRLGGGFPADRSVGRIGLAVSRSNPAVVYALLDNQGAKTAGRARHGGSRSGLAPADLEKMAAAAFLALEDERLALFLGENRAPKIFSPMMLKNFVRSGLLTPPGIAQMLFDANDRRLNPNTIGAEVYRSGNGGRTWQKVNQGYIEEMYLTYGFYFGQVRVAPDDENKVYILGINALVSTDGGRSFRNLAPGQRPFADALVHRDHHALWIDPRDPRRLLLGNDGGVNLSADGGQSWSKVGNLSISQCYTVTADDEEPAHVFIGTQDNGVLVAPLPPPGGMPRWRMLLGGDGARVLPLPGPPRLWFAAAQFGALVRFAAAGGGPQGIKPRSPQLSEPYRFHWLSPLLASRTRPGEIFFAANRVLRSRDDGASWQAISPDLSGLRHIDGNTPFGTISALAVSGLSPGILFAGTDDGNVWLGRGQEPRWTMIGQVLPRKPVSQVLASRFQAERVYVLLNGGKEDDFQPYIFMSENAGLDWESLRANLPPEPLNVLAEDPDREGILYLGSDRGLYASPDGGASWLSLQGDLPTVPVLDIFIHRRARLLIAATFGRGVYTLPLDEIRKRLPATENP